MNTIGITMGCPAGIGPEILLRYLSRVTADSAIRHVILGDIGVLEKCGRELSIGHALKVWQPGTALPDNATPVVPVSRLDTASFTWGQPNVSTGRAMADYIITAVDLARRNLLDGIATCPISKSSLNKAGYLYPGHTEMLAQLTGSDDYCMMMAGKKLRVTLVTIHCDLAKVPSLLNRQAVFKLITTTDKALKMDFGIRSPRIGVAGLNPHGGEEGLFGSEELMSIKPAVDQAKSAGIDAAGPFPPDTVFYRAACGDFDAVVCMYHDQGLIPFKLLHFEDGVNVTLGLPLVRTSVDHGTAYDIAGKGIANHHSLREAVRLAAFISRNRKNYCSSLGTENA